MKSIEKDNLASIKQQLMSLASKSRLGGNTYNENQQSGRGDSPDHYPPHTDASERTLQAARARQAAPS